MLIADMKWSENDCYLVIGFIYGYFCIISRLGHLINIMTPLKILQSFYFFKENHCLSIELHESFIIGHNNDNVMTIHVTDIPTFMELNNPRGRINTLLAFSSTKPELSISTEVMDKLIRLCNIELLHMKPSKPIVEAVNEGFRNSTILFVNAYSNKVINANKVFKSTANFIESLRWGVIEGKVFNKVINEMENSMKLLLQSKYLPNK